jgi:hypothetical protein
MAGVHFILKLRKLRLRAQLKKPGLVDKKIITANSLFAKFQREYNRKLQVVV